MSLPASRRVVHGRTFRQSWNPSDYAGIEPPVIKRRARLLDRLCWICSGLLVLAALTAPQWWPR